MSPTQIAQHGFAQPVPVPYRESGMVRSSIAFDAQEIAVRVVRVPDTKIDAKAGHADLRVNLKALTADSYALDGCSWNT